MFKNERGNRRTRPFAAIAAWLDSHVGMQATKGRPRLWRAETLARQAVNGRHQSIYCEQPRRRGQSDAVL